MRLPKRGIAVDKLVCKECGKNVKACAASGCKSSKPKKKNKI